MFRALDARLPSTDLWDVWPRRTGASTPASPIAVPRRRRPSTCNERLNLLRDIHADPELSCGTKLDTAVTLANHASQLEAVYSTVPPWCRAKIKEAFSIILHGQEEDMWRFVKSCRAQWNTLSLREIAAPATYSPLAADAVDLAAPFRRRAPIHVEAARMYNDRLDEMGLAGKYKKIEDGDQFNYVLLSEPNPLTVAAIGFTNMLPPVFGLYGYVDRRGQFDLCFLEPLNRALALIGWRDKNKRALGVLAQEART
jgi:hypothetical protein